MNKIKVSVIVVVLAIGLATFGLFYTSMPDAPEEKNVSAEAGKSESELQIDTILNEMTLEEKVGQMFMGCFYGGTPSPETVSEYHLGGVLLFGASFKDTPREGLISGIEAIDSACGISPLFAVDEEGGTVVRASAYEAYRSEPFRSPREIFEEGGMDAVIADAHEKNVFLKELGFHLNLAPVCDISLDPNDFMYARSLGQDAETTSAFTAGVVKACREDGIACCLKHFPGYGNTQDTHEGTAFDERSLEELQRSDLLPFRAGIEAGAPAVLVSHNIVTSLDKELPASLSPVIHELLRDDLGFDGVIVTDDMSMGAISDFSPEADSAVTAVLAGNDLLCTGDYATQYEAVLNAVKDGTIAEETVDRSVRRILKMKQDLGLLS